MTVYNNAPVNQLLNLAASDGRITTREAEQVAKQLSRDSGVTQTEKDRLRLALQTRRYQDAFEPGAAAPLRALLAQPRAEVLDAARYLEGKPSELGRQSSSFNAIAGEIDQLLGKNLSAAEKKVMTDGLHAFLARPDTGVGSNIGKALMKYLFERHGLA